MNSCLFNGERIHTGRFVYEPPVWEGIFIPGSAMSNAAGSGPSWAQFRDDGAVSFGVFAWLFAPGSRERLTFSVQVPHAYDEQTTVSPIAHWSPTTANAGDVLWSFEVTIATPGAAFPVTSSGTGLDAASGIYVHEMAEMSNLNMAGNLIMTVLHFQLFRNGPSAADTYPDDAALHGFQLNFIKDAPGSRTELAK